MKHIILSFAFLLTSVSLFAQAPQRMTYQAVIRNASNTLIVNSPVGVQISVLQGSANGVALFIERHTPTTNQNGLATLEIGAGTLVSGSFGAIDWSNGPLFLKTETDPTGGTTYSITGTSQFLSVPYALYAENSGDVQTLSLTGTNLTISGGNTVSLAGIGQGNTLNGAYDQGGAGAGRIITADAGEVEINAVGANAIGLRTANAGTGVAIIASSTSPSNTFSTIQSSTASSSTNASGIIGNSTGAAWGVSGQVAQSATAQAAVYGSNLRTTGGHGVFGIGVNGVVGQTSYSAGNAVYGENFDNIAPLGNGIGTAGKGYYGVLGEDRYLGGVSGAYGVLSNGNLGATGTKTFLIDHPEDPENKFLRHFSTESNEVLNIYRGNAVMDANGEAIVELPSYYDAINTNPSYHLTPIGGYAQLYIKEELNDGKFIIAGGTDGLKVSWTVYSERNDAYLQTYPDQRATELEKREGQKGKYVMPALYGAPESQGLFNSDVNNAEQMNQPRIELKP